LVNCTLSSFQKGIFTRLNTKDAREVTGISLDLDISGSIIVVFLKPGGIEATRV
jgi:hypothetical protein